MNSFFLLWRLKDFSLSFDSLAHIKESKYRKFSEIFKMMKSLHSINLNLINANEMLDTTVRMIFSGMMAMK